MDFLNFFSRKHIIYGTLVVLAAGAVAFFWFKNYKGQGQTLVIRKGEFLQQVSVSGNVVAKQNLDLSFGETGIVKKVYVKVGDKVSVGQLLASQDTSQLQAQFQETQAGIDFEKAKLAQLLAGASYQDIKVSENSVALAQQNLNNAYQTALINLSNAYTAIYNAYTSVVSVQNNFFSTTDQQSLKVQDNRINIQNKMADAKSYLDSAKNSSSTASIDASLAGIVTDLNNVYDSLSLVRNQCDEGIYYFKVPSADKTALDTQKTNINNALTNITGSQQNISGYKLSLQQAQNQLDLKKAAPRDTDTAVYQAKINQAEASLQGVWAQIRKQQIFSPIDGVITKFNAKAGNVFSANQIAVSVISKDPLQIESYVPEIYVPLVKAGNEALVTLDAFGQDTVFLAKVVSIDPAETIKDGVSTYKTTLQFNKLNSSLKDGMTANIIITTEKRSGVISIPKGAVRNDNGKKFVRVKEGKSIIKKEITTGSVSSSGQIEVSSGLQEGEVVILN